MLRSTTSRSSHPQKARERLPALGAPSKAHNLCRSCRQDFSSLGAFDRHRTGIHAYDWTPELEDGRRCMDEKEMRKAGMDLDPRGRWCITADVERAREAFGTDSDCSVCSSGAHASAEPGDQVA